jgi:hypothetical protein
VSPPAVDRVEQGPPPQHPSFFSLAAAGSRPRSLKDGGAGAFPHSGSPEIHHPWWSPRRRTATVVSQPQGAGDGEIRCLHSWIGWPLWLGGWISAGPRGGQGTTASSMAAACCVDDAAGGSGRGRASLAALARTVTHHLEDLAAASAARRGHRRAVCGQLPAACGRASARV